MLGLKPEEKADLAGTIGRMKTVHEFLADAVEGFKGTGLPKLVAEALPWAGIVGEAAAGALPPIKFLLELFKKLAKIDDPRALGYLACTMAYQQAVQQSIEAVGGPKGPKEVAADIRAKLRAATTADGFDFGRFSYGSALQHPFIKEADDLFLRYAQAIGYDETERRRLVGQVHTRFVVNLKTILADGSLREKFAPFEKLLDLGTDEARAYHALAEHADYQRWLFEQRPVFDKEPFALAHVYIDAECGKLEWGQIRGDQPEERRGKEREVRPLDPFAEASGGREPLLSTVLDYLGRRDFRDAIVIQGIAGAGKSTFTLRLCSELVREGLCPIRVQLRHLVFGNRTPLEDLGRAVVLSDGPRGSQPDDLFLGGRIFREEIGYRGTSISPYVLILDGWDEISLSASEGFKQRLARFLENVRAELLPDRRDQVPIRVILTGRPSPVVGETLFLRDKTPILTIRPFKPDDLERFIRRLDRALEERPTPVEDADFWIIDDTSRFASVVEQYRSEFGEETSGSDWFGPSTEESGSMAVLGLPLLAHLAVRLMAQWPGDLRALLASPTTLYRNLVDLTCSHGAKAGDPVPTHYRGEELRDLLRRTAAAMTITGQESISYHELAARLGMSGDALDQRVQEATRGHDLSRLVISYFFKGGQHDYGCEFVHKSFREYFFAEGVVEELKRHGRTPVRPPERTPDWKDFADDDPRHHLSRALADSLGPQWMSREVAAHIGELIHWEVDRAVTGEPPGRATKPIDLAGWEAIRDGLADIWDWWADGVHMRPQPERKNRGLDFRPALVHILVDRAAPLVHDPHKLPVPSTFTAIDAHLGDGIFRLCCFVHDHAGPLRGLPDSAGPMDLRRYQMADVEGPRRVRFAPSGDDTNSFAYFMARINTAHGRSWKFPSEIDMSNCSLINVALDGARLDGARLIGASLDRASLVGARLDGARLIGASLDRARLDGARPKKVVQRLIDSGQYRPPEPSTDEP